MRALRTGMSVSGSRRDCQITLKITFDCSQAREHAEFEYAGVCVMLRVEHPKVEMPNLDWQLLPDRTSDFTHPQQLQSSSPPTTSSYTFSGTCTS